MTRLFRLVPVTRHRFAVTFLKDEIVAWSSRESSDARKVTFRVGGWPQCRNLASPRLCTCKRNSPLQVQNSVNGARKPLRDQLSSGRIPQIEAHQALSRCAGKAQRNGLAACGSEAQFRRNGENRTTPSIGDDDADAIGQQ